jgi:hypothetical protein
VSSSGKFSADAEFIAIEGGNVKLKKQDGRTVSVPLVKLDEASQQQALKLSIESSAKPQPHATEIAKKNESPSSVEQPPLGSQHRDPSIPVSPPASNETKGRAPTREQLLAEYRTLAELLAMDIKTSPDEFEKEDNKDLASRMATGHEALLMLKQMRAQDPDIKYVAEQSSEAWKQGLARMEALMALPQPPSDGELFISSFFAGLVAGDAVGGGLAGGAIGADAEDKRRAIINELQGVIAAADTCQRRFGV